MVFSSIFFLFLFLPLVLLANFLAPKFIRNAILWIFSLVFYAWGEPVYVILMLFSTVFNYVMGLDIESRQLDRKAARNSLILAVAVNLFILGFFKYSGFLIDTGTEKLYQFRALCCHVPAADRGADRPLYRH